MSGSCEGCARGPSRPTTGGRAERNTASSPQLRLTALANRSRLWVARGCAGLQLREFRLCVQSAECRGRAGMTWPWPRAAELTRDAVISPSLLSPRRRGQLRQQSFAHVLLLPSRARCSVRCKKINQWCPFTPAALHHIPSCPDGEAG